MKKIIVILMLLGLVGVSWADEKTELQWKARALVAEANLAQRAIQEFIKELDLKGFTISQDGAVVEKPKLPTVEGKPKP
jgi:hypothetical protein